MIVTTIERRNLTAVVIGGLLAVGVSVVSAIRPDLVLLGLALGALAGIALRYPGVLLGLYLTVPPFFKAALQPYVPVDLTLLLAAYCASQALVLLSGHRPPARALILWGGLAVVVGASTMWATFPDIAGERAVYWLALGFLPLLAVFRVARDDRHVRHLLWTLAAAAAVVIVAGLLDYDPGERLTTLEANVIGAGRAALMLPILALGLTDERRPVRLALLAVTPVALYVALAAGARGPVLALVIVVAVWALAMLTRRGGVLRVAVIALWAAMLYVALQSLLPPLPQISLDRLAALALFTGEASGLDAVRTDLYALAAETFLRQPIAGIGIGNFAGMLPPGLHDLRYPHNIALQIAAELGLMGLLVFGGLLAAALARRDLGGAVWLTVRLLALFWLLNALVSSDALEVRPFWALLMLLIVAPSAPHPRSLQGRADGRASRVVQADGDRIGGHT